MLYLETHTDTFTPWRGERIDGVAHPRSIEHKWTETELAAVGLYKPAPADPVPDGKVVASTDVQRVDGVVKFVHTLQDAPPPSVPQEVTARQARLALNQAGKRGQVEQAVSNASQDIQDYWEYSITIGRQHPILLSLAKDTLGMTDSELDNLFLAAGQL